MARTEPPSQRWQTVLNNHAEDIVSVDFITVPTIGYQVPYVFLMDHNASRRILHFNVTANPNPDWTALQILQAFPWDTAPKYAGCIIETSGRLRRGGIGVRMD